ncbi:FERM domain-containing protein 4A-like [Oopsacas minuta]|uniref:FERM domain-containing protein 4A-like n=1 Tax=Oopsacas minuta TaxID=111878 RepID=A0AAV7JYN9_9METZ|nr:FERM domain-containing protein 4A-like [Oopsacas minuta]
MPEVNVRDCYIHLIDGYKLTVQVRPLQLTSDLMNIIANQLKLRDKEYFGLYYEVNGSLRYWDKNGESSYHLYSGRELYRFLRACS